MITEAILRLKRLWVPLKLAGLAFLVFHCATADIGFNPTWILVYVAVVTVVSSVGVATESLVLKAYPRKKDKNATSFTTDEKRCLAQMNAQGQEWRAKPWRFLLIAGEDGIFFLPLLYIGITVPAAVAASALFAAMHYRDKPSSALAGTFVFSTVNALVVLPHGILPMVLGHFVLDATAFGLAPTMKKWVDADQLKKDLPNQTPEATSAPETYRRQRVIRTQEVLDAFHRTGNLAQIMPEVLRNQPGILPILRMATAPPVARDRLMGLAYVTRAQCWKVRSSNG